MTKEQPVIEGERRPQKSEAEKGQEKFLAFMENAPDAVIIYNLDDTFSEVNPAAARLTGYSQEEMLSMKVTDFLRPSEGIRLQVVKEERKRGSRRLVEWQVKCKDGTFVDIEANTHFLPDKQQLISFIRDISYRKAMEDEIYQAGIKQKLLKTKTRLLKQQQKKLLAINKAKDDFILVASHQLRTPATSVKQYISMLLEDYFGELSERQRQVLTTAYDSNERQLRIINDLLVIAKVDSGEVVTSRRAQDVVVLIKKLAEELTPSITLKKQILEVRTPKSLKLRCDAVYLKIALMHLLKNASHYSEEGKPILMTLERQDGLVVITVADKGVGIKKEDQRLLFQKFMRISNQLSDFVDGNGLGLYVAKQIIALHNGTILLESRHGHGSTFTVKLPA